MKFIFMTQPDSSGISDVFNTLLLQEGNAPQAMIDRYTEIANSSPIQPLVVTGKENIAVNSTWDPETELFTLGEGYTSDYARPLNVKTVVFLINNIVKGHIVIPSDGIQAEPLAIAYSEPINIVSLPDDSTVEVGHTWNGTTFTAPE